MKMFCCLMIAWLTVLAEVAYLMAIMYALPKAPSWMVKMSDSGLLAYREPVEIAFALFGFAMFATSVVLISAIVDSK